MGLITKLVTNERFCPATGMLLSLLEITITSSDEVQQRKLREYVSNTAPDDITIVVERHEPIAGGAVYRRTSNTLHNGGGKNAK